jgi:membrane protease YdiL (CAAX protease family)
MKQLKFDKWLAIFAGLLIIIGLVMLYSVSTVESLDRYGNTTYYIQQQLLKGGILGLLGFGFFYRFPYRKLKTLAFPIMIGALFLLLLVKMPGIGFAAGVVGGAGGVGGISYAGGIIAYNGVLGTTIGTVNNSGTISSTMAGLNGHKVRATGTRASTNR